MARPQSRGCQLLTHRPHSTRDMVCVNDDDGGGDEVHKENNESRSISAARDPQTAQQGEAGLLFISDFLVATVGSS